VVNVADQGTLATAGAARTTSLLLALAKASKRCLSTCADALPVFNDMPSVSVADWKYQVEVSLEL
jgi:hypothetical protein